MARYELMNLVVEPEYSNEWETVMVADIRRDDGETGDIWIVAGVPDYLRGTAKAAGTSRNLMSVRVFGDSPDCWCPASFDYNDSDAMLDAIRDASIAKHADQISASVE